MGVIHQNSGEDRPPVRLAATYTSAPIAELTGRIGRDLGWPTGLTEAPYGRFAMHLADPASPFWSKASARIILWRPEDLGEDREAAVRDLTDNLIAHHDDHPLLIVVSDRTDEAEVKTRDELGQRLAGLSGCTIVAANEVFSRYDIAGTRDRLTDDAGHIPYKDDALAALGLSIARWADNLLRPPLKVMAVDGDHTLWRGVLGEDGVRGVSLDGNFRELQRELKDAASSGVILAMLTKNDEADIREVLDTRDDFPLSSEDFLSIRAGWDDKSEALEGLIHDLSLGANAVLFLDDNPVECARMRAAMPDVLTVAVPEAGPSLQFVHHLWPLDRGEATADDLKRVERYRQEETRSQARRRAGSLDDFFASLDLEVDIFEPDTDEIPRLAQLSQRTNQFSTSLLRLVEGDVTAQVSKTGGFVRGIRVRDRFGDYGIVGLLYGEQTGDSLYIRLWSLSCRVLGRGVEHEVMRYLGTQSGVSFVYLDYRTGPRNAPALNFLNTLPGVVLEDEGEVETLAKYLADFRFDPHTESAEEVTSSSGEAHTGISRGEVYDRIANGLAAGIAPSALFISRHARPALESAYIPPRGEIETAIAAIWADVLGIDRVGREDDFHALGGRSLNLVRIYARLVRELGADLNLADLFRFPTVAALAAFLSGEKETKNPRAAAMRAARTRRAGRRP